MGNGKRDCEVFMGFRCLCLQSYLMTGGRGFPRSLGHRLLVSQSSSWRPFAVISIYFLLKRGRGASGFVGKWFVQEVL